MSETTGEIRISQVHQRERVFRPADAEMPPITPELLFQGPPSVEPSNLIRKKCPNCSNIVRSPSWLSMEGRCGSCGVYVTKVKP